MCVQVSDITTAQPEISFSSSSSSSSTHLKLETSSEMVLETTDEEAVACSGSVHTMLV